MITKNIDYRKSIGIIPYALSERGISDALYSDIPLSGMPQNKDEWPEKFALFNKETEQSEVNSFGFRSEEFKKYHSGKHILFLGCSCTWGSGLLIEELWSKKIFNKISEQETTSGYFNLAVPGDSIYMQVSNAFKYFKHFGNPDYIFFNIPDFYRFYAYLERDNALVRSFIEKNDNHILNLLSYQYYYILDQYCRNNNIKLYSFTWTDTINNDIDNKHFKNSKVELFETFYKIDPNNLVNHIYELKDQNPKQEFIEYARDGDHPGTGYHDYWFNFIYNKYKENNDSPRN